MFGTNLNDPKKRKITRTEPYANLAPFSAPLETIALKQEFYRRKKQGFRADEAFAKTFNKAMKGVLNQSAFGSVKDGVRAAENIADTTIALDKDGNPETGTVMSILTGGGGKVVSRKLSGVIVPNIVRDVRKLLDKRILEPKGLLEELRASLPRVGKVDPSKGIKVRQTTFGADAKQTQKRLPFTPFNAKIDRTLEEMARLEVFPAPRAPKQASIKKLKIVLTEEEQQQFNFAGPLLKKVLDKIVEAPFYKNSEDLIRATILEKVIENFRSNQLKAAKGKGFIRLLQSPEGIQQMLLGVTKGRTFTPFQPNSK